MTKETTLQRPRPRPEAKARPSNKEAAPLHGRAWLKYLDQRIDEGYRRNEAERYRSYLRAFEPAQIKEMLKKIDPEGKATYGTRFVERMLASQGGKRELEHFINRALAIMDVENGLDIAQDFTPEQRDMLLSDDKNWKPLEVRIAQLSEKLKDNPSDAPLNERIDQLKSQLATRPGNVHGSLTRRAMMGAGVIGAAGLTAEGLVGGASHAAGLKKSHFEKEKEGWRRELQKTQERVEILESAVLATIGVHYAHDVHVEYGRLKDEEVARRLKEVEDVVYDLAQLARERRPRSVADIYRGAKR